MHCTVVVIVVAIVGAAVVAAAEHNPQLKGQFNNTEGYSLVQYPTFLYWGQFVFKSMHCPDVVCSYFFVKINKFIDNL